MQFLLIISLLLLAGQYVVSDFQDENLTSIQHDVFLHQTLLLIEGFDPMTFNAASEYATTDPFNDFDITSFTTPNESEISFGQPCVPGTSWTNDCNFCTCNSNGVGVCTTALCLVSEGSANNSELPSGKQCLPGTSWRSRCNDCFCNSNGFAMCTLTLCLGYQTEPLMTCAPNTTWKYQCNTCRCTTSGEPDCTRMRCPPKVS